MTQCQCLAESTGKQCTRDAKPNSPFCWQHAKKCIRTQVLRGPVGIASTVTEPIKFSRKTSMKAFRSPTLSSKVSLNNVSPELEDRYRQIREEAQRQLFNSGTYQEYREFVKSLERSGDFILPPSFQEYEDMLDFAIQRFEEQYPQEDRNFDDMNERERRQFLINIGESLGILKKL